jgi:CheY-like chemotaxis protein
VQQQAENMAHADILVTVRPKHAARYQQQLAAYPELRVRIARSLDQALDMLADHAHPVDLLVLDNSMSGVFELVADLRQTYRRLLIVLVDEDADFAMPGQADDISTDPFSDGDLARRITRLITDRHLETLRADSMYSLEPVELTLQAQAGAPPLKATSNGIVAWVAKTGQSRIATAPSGGSLSAGQLSAVACTPIGMTDRYGVLVVCRTAPNTITQQQLPMLEMLSAQLAAALAKE